MTLTAAEDITELTELHAEKVSGVTSPANGTSFILLKATEAEDCDTCGGKGTIREGNMKCPDCKGSGKQSASKSDAPEADEQEETMTGEAAKEWAGVYCGDQSCEVCVIKDESGLRFHPAVKALSEADRKKMPASAFAFIDKNGGRHLPIHDTGHIKSALGRHSQQDFSEAKGDPADAKKKAAKKIVAAAKAHDIDVDSGSAVAQAAKQVGPGVGEHGLATPQAAGHLDGSKSGLAGSVTTGPAAEPPNATLRLGGASRYEIPLEQRVQNNPPIPVTTDGAGITDSHLKAALAKTVEEISGLIQARAAATVVKEGKVLTLTPPQGDAALSPGSPSWESHDAATLQQIGQALAECCSALDMIVERERTEGATVDPGDVCHAWDLEEAEQALDYALGVVARLSFHEAAEGQATKAGRVISGKNVQELTAARDHLQAVIDGAQGKPAASADDSDKESDKIMTTLTKDELESIAADSATAAVKAAFDKQDEERKAKKARKKAEKGAAEEAAKNAIEAGAPKDDGPNGKADSNDVTAIPDGGHVDPQYMNKQLEEMQKGLEQMQAQFAQTSELVERIAKRPRHGGPVLGGHAPQGAGDPAAVAKGQDDGIQQLAKALADANASGTPQQIEAAGEAYSRAVLTAFNAARGIPTGAPTP